MIKTKQLWRTCIALIATMFLGMSIQAQSVTIGTGTGTASGTNGTPIYRSSNTSSFHHSKSIQLLTQSQLNTAGLVGGETITGWGYNKQNNGAPSGTNAWTLNVYLKNTSSTALVSGTAWNTMISGATLAYTATINASNMPTATGYWVWPTTGFTYSGGAIEAYIEWFPAGTMTSPFTTNNFLWQFTASGNQAMGFSNSTAIPGTTSSWTAQARFYNTQINYVSGPCSGTPAPGNTTGPASACSGSPFSLGLQTPTTGSGVSYQWYSSPDGITYTPISGANSSTYSTTQTSATYYYCDVTCSSGPATGSSTPLLVGMSSFLNCYCATSYSNCSGDGIINVVAGSLSNASAGCPGSGNYTYFTPGVSSGTFYQGSTYTLAVTVQSDPNQWTNAWIDYDQNGTLDAGEVLSASAVNPGANGTTAISFTIPPTAATGLTRLRVRGGVDATFTAAQACGANVASLYGEVEDYDITIATPPACSGSPIATTASASNGTICPGGSSTLSVTSPGIETGYTYQWESFDGTNWNPISGANASTYVVAPTATTDYRCVITCTNSSLSTPSSTTTVTFDASADAGTISGPTSGSTYQALAYSTGAYVGALQWQTATNPAGPWSDVAAATTDNVSLISNAAGTFYVRLRAASATCTTFSNVIMVVITIPNDNVCNALPLTLGTVASPVVNGPYTNVGATTEAGEAQAPTTGCATQTGWCAAPSGTISNSIWFSFVAPASGRVSIELDPTNYWDSQIALWSASACGDLTSGAGTLVAANDDIAGSPFHSKILATCLTPGTTYYVQVDGYGATTKNNMLLLVNDEGGRTAAISGTTAICEGSSTNLTINFGGTAPWTYSINGGAPVTTSSNPEIISVSPLTTTSYTISSVDASCPVEWSGSADITVNPLPSVEAQDVSGCPGSNITLLGTPAGGTFTAAAGTVTGNLYNGPATTYYYTYTDMNGCTNTSATHNILPTVLNPVTGITFGTITGNTAAITWNAVAGAAWYTLRYRVVGGSTWIFATSNTTSITLTGLTPASDYELEARANCSVLAPGVYGSYTTFSTGAACAAPTGMAVVPVTGSNGTKVKLTFTSNIAAGWHVLRYRIAYSSNAWSVISPANGAGTTITGLTASTQYEYQLQSKCSSTNIGSWTAVDYFTTGGNPSKEMNEVVETYVSNVSIYPNPTRDVLNIELSAVENASTVVKVFDMSGRLVKQIQANTEKGTNNLVIDLKDVTNGIYTVQVLENGKLTNVTKVTKQD